MIVMTISPAGSNKTKFQRKNVTVSLYKLTVVLSKDQFHEGNSGLIHHVTMIAQRKFACLINHTVYLGLHLHVGTEFQPQT